MLVTSNLKEDLREMMNLNNVFCIFEALLFQKDKNKLEIIVLINFRVKIKIINPVYVAGLSF